jgi:hypothetical protein
MRWASFRHSCTSLPEKSAWPSGVEWRARSGIAISGVHSSAERSNADSSPLLDQAGVRLRVDAAPPPERPRRDQHLELGALNVDVDEVDWSSGSEQLAQRHHAHLPDRSVGAGVVRPDERLPVPGARIADVEPVSEEPLE